MVPSAVALIFFLLGHGFAHQELSIPHYSEDATTTTVHSYSPMTNAFFTRTNTFHIGEAATVEI